MVAAATVKGIAAGAPVALWVVAILAPIMSSVALALQYALVDFIEDDSKLTADRLKCFDYFGTFIKAVLTIFEVTKSHTTEEIA